MNKRFVIRDYKGKPKKITISNYENVKVILYEKISGDQILTIVYKNGEGKTFDSCDSGRIMAFHDDTAVFMPNELTQKELNELVEHYYLYREGENNNERN